MKKRNILKILAVIFMIIFTPILIVGCKNQNEPDPQNFRVKDGYIQYTKDGKTWINLIQAEYPISEYDFRIQDGYVQWTTDGVTWTDIIKTEETKTYTITYDYGAGYGIEDTSDNIHQSVFSSNVPQTETIKEGELLQDLPSPLWPYQESFKGWFITGTDKQICEYDLISGDITLEARFDYTSNCAPSGLYNNGKYIKRWKQLIDEEEIIITNGTLTNCIIDSGDLKISTAVTSIGENAFSKNQHFLTGVAIPGTIEEIGEGAFSRCNLLTNVTIFQNEFDANGYSLRIIEANAFYGCEKLKSITIPLSVNMIKDSAFSLCTNLTSINLTECNTTVWKLYKEGEVISQNAAILSDKEICFYLRRTGYELKQVTERQGADYVTISTKVILAPVTNKDITEFYFESYFSNPVIEIDEYAFSYCNKLTQITIPDSVVKIGKHAFRYCYTLNTITFEEKDGYKWQVYENNAWRDAETSELFSLAKSGYELQRVAE